MEQIYSTIEIKTKGEGFIDITCEINEFLEKNNLLTGIININSMHTSCSLIVNENADSNVLYDLKKYMKSIVPENSYRSLAVNNEEVEYKHSQEGSDDMPAHIKTALTNTSLSFSFINKKILLGIWQSVYLWEHRFDKKNRSIHLHAIGEK
tara:strand:+ start:906 stop:1358 length:453 start_codon:yes stop_codon:yes gene_type:complete